LESFLSRSSRALGIPEGVFKICPDRRHVMATQVASCPYCLEEQDGRALKGSSDRNPVNALDQLRRAALDGNEDTSLDTPDEEPQPLMRTQVRHQVDSFRDTPPTPPAPAPAPALSAAPAAQVANIGPEAPEVDPSTSTTPFGGPPGLAMADSGDGLNKTQPLAAMVSGDVKTNVMVAVGSQNPVLGWIRGLNGPVKGRSFDICHGRNILGSDSSCSVVIPSADVRPRHVSIMANDQGITATLTDTASSLKVNGVLKESQPLLDGDLVELGPAAFRFRSLSERDLSSAHREGS